MTTFADRIEPSVVGRLTLKLLNGVSLLISKLTRYPAMKLEHTGNLNLLPNQCNVADEPCECGRPGCTWNKPMLMLPDYSNRKGRDVGPYPQTKRKPPVARSKQAKSKHHMNTLFQYGWTAKEIPMMGQKGQFNKSIFVPRITDQSIHLDGWYVARTRPKNKKYRWSIVMPDEKVGRKILRHNQSNRPMRFSTPANAIIACEKAALKHRAYHAVIKT